MAHFIYQPPFIQLFLPPLAKECHCCPVEFVVNKLGTVNGGARPGRRVD